MKTYVRPRSLSDQHGKPKSRPSLLGYLTSPHGPHIPALLAPAPSAPAPAGAHSSSPGSLAPVHALPMCSPALPRPVQRAPSPRAPPRHRTVIRCMVHPRAPPRRRTRTRSIPFPRARGRRGACVSAAATRLLPHDARWPNFVPGRVRQCFSEFCTSRLPGKRRIHWGVPVLYSGVSHSIVGSVSHLPASVKSVIVRTVA